MRDKIIEIARSYLGCKWKHQGRSKKWGIDCAGLAIKVGHELKSFTFDIKAYQRQTVDDAFIHHFKAHMDQVPILERKLGDVILLRQGVFSCHCGILSKKNGKLYIIHASPQAGKVIEELYTKELQNRTTYCFRYRI